VWTVLAFRTAQELWRAKDASGGLAIAHGRSV
jgi:hypothetical protein